MLKFLSLALVLTAANCQLLSGLDGQSIVSGGTQYVLVPVNTGVQSSAVRIAPYLQRQAYSIAAPAPQIIQAPAPRPVVLQAPKPVVLSAPQVSVNEAPQPYTFGFQSTDELGNTLSRSETADGSGTVTGSYSYLDAEGLTRVVEYVADAAGYRATVKTNEPGTANANPADVQIESSEPPANVQQAIAAYSAPRAAQAAPRAAPKPRAN